MRITFIGQLYSDKQIQTFGAKKWKLDNAADALQRLIITGLRSNGSKVDIVSFPRVPSFPTTNESYFKTVESRLEDETFVSLGFVNFPIIKHISKSIQLFKWIKHFKGGINNPVIIYSLHSPLLLPFFFLKKKFPVILVVPDLPQFMSDSKNLLYKMGKKIDGYILKKCIDKIDGFVLLSEYMNPVINRSGKSWTLMEGICNNNDLTTNIAKNIDYRYILYTGTLDVRYGILNLVKAFIKAKTNDIKLVLCGCGDAEKEIKQISERYDDIIFLGQIPRPQAVQLQKNAILLINPRTSQGEFTKYSFPSKTMEYLASGTPTLMYRLPGIPEEYYEYFFSPKDESIEALSTKIEEILQMPDIEIQKIGVQAKEFVTSEKNPKVQAKKIISLIKELS